MKSRNLSVGLRTAFTLVEVLAGMSVFVVVVLGGFVAVSQLLSHQSETYARTRAASLAMHASNMYMHALNYTSSRTTIPSPHPVFTPGDPSQLFITVASPPTATDTYIGATPSDYRSGGSWYFPSESTLGPTNPSSVPMRSGSYDDLMVYLSPSSTESNEYMKYAYMSIWQVDRVSFELTPASGTVNRKLRFLGRYVMVVDRAP
jgi:hypothetical protein